MSSSSSIRSEVVKGKLKVFLGYAAGVGKTYQMLEEAHQLKRQSTDIAIGYFEPHARPDTIVLLNGLEVIPRKVVEYRGARFEEMDTDAILHRRPSACVVDELPHTNVPGWPTLKRWEDVLVLLDNGIDVLTTMNIQHLESLNDQIYHLTGVRVRETVPDWVVQEASEVVMVDLTPRALLNRLDRGVVYQGQKAQQAKENFFKESTLVALRELALRETAFEIESRYAAPREIPGSSGPSSDAVQNVLVHITPDRSSVALIRRGKRVADYLQVECFAVALATNAPEQEEAVEKYLNFARSLHIDTHVLKGPDVPDEIVSFARQHGVTQIYLARPPLSRWSVPFAPNFIQRIVRLAGDMEVTIVAERAPVSFTRWSKPTRAHAQKQESL